MEYRRKSIPRYIPHGIEQTYYKIPCPPLSSKKRTHSIEKYTPRTYLHSTYNRSSLNKTTALSAVRSPKRLSYDYEIRVRNSIQFPSQEYQKLASIINKYQSSGAPTRKPSIDLSKKNCQMLPNLDKREAFEGTTILDYTQLKELKSALNKTVHLEKNPKKVLVHSGNELVKTIVKKHENELRNIFLRKDQPEESSSSLASVEDTSDIQLKKIVMRKKWDKLQKRNLFRFEVDTINDTVSLKRVEKDSDTVTTTLRLSKRVISDNGPTMSSQLQKRRLAPKFCRKDSITVLYELPDIDKETIHNYERKKPFSRQLSKAPISGLDLESLWLKVRTKDTPKAESVLQKLFGKETAATTFDLSKIDISTLDLPDLFTLYTSFKAALNPCLTGVSPPELQQLDPEVLNLGLPELTPYDQSLIAQYKSYLAKTETEEVFTGFWTHKRSSKLKPICREGMAYISVGKRVYLFGGYGNEKLQDLWCLSNGPQYDWTLIRPIGRQLPDRRFGHCMTAYGNKIYVHAGGGDFVTGIKLRATLNDLWYYSIEDNMWTKLEHTTDKNVKAVQRRVNAGSAAMDNLWLIHGGYDGSKQNMLSDLTAFDLVNGRFVELVTDFSSGKQKMGALMGHSMISVLPEHLTKRPENTEYWSNFHHWKFTASDTLKPSKIGIYVLGGINGEGQYNTNVWIIRCNPQKTMEMLQLVQKQDQHPIKKYVAEISKLTLKGTPPKPRAHQSAIFFKNYIAVFGGKNDQKAFEPDTHCLNDLCLLDLTKNEWLPVVTYGFTPTPRWSQAAVLQENDQIMVFGGVTDKRYCSFNTYLLETGISAVAKNLTECKKIKAMVEREARKRKDLKI